jgi:hypothetical protein
MSGRRARALRAARVTVAQATWPAVAALARSTVDLVTLTHRAWADLERAAGGTAPALGWLRALCTEHDRAVAINAPTSSSTSTTLVIAPPSWGRARLARVVAAVQPELDSLFGPGTERTA